MRSHLIFLLVLSAGVGVGSVSCSSDPAPVQAELFCKDGKRVPGAYPKAGATVAEGQIAADHAFASDEGQIALGDYFDPCAEKSSLLVVRIGAPWCGTCDWHASHTGEIIDSDVGSRVRFLDLMIADEDNQPPRTEGLAAYRKRIDRPGKVAIDPEMVLGALNTPRGSLPLYALVDTKTMKILRALPNPGPDLLISRIRQELATLDKTPVPNTVLDDRIDEYFGRDQWDLLRKMTLPGAPPPDPSNAVADSPSAASLGKDLFGDVSLTPNGKVSCATCHVPEKNFTDGLAQGVGVARVDRHTPAIALSSFSRSQFWDGRADSLWMQALGPFESEKEIGTTRLFVAHTVFSKYKVPYEAIFGPLPPLADLARFPAQGMPGSPEWESMAPADRELVTRVFVNVGKSIAAFERTLRLAPTKFDAYVAGNTSALADIEKHSVHEFFENGCAQCHHGPRMTDDAYHNLRFGTGRADGLPDLGRSEGIPKLLASELRTTGRFSDLGLRDTSAEDAWLTSIAKKMEGRFKTPTIRGSATNGPYGHGGTIATPEELARHYGERGLPPESPLAIGATEEWAPTFSTHHQDLISVFIKLMKNDVAK